MSRPNVVLVVMDTARAADVTLGTGDDGLAGDSPDAAIEGTETTPTIRSIAEAGTTFSNAWAAAPWTLPSHASLFTGTYPSKHGAHADHKYLDDDLPTLAECFRDGGYETVAVSNNTWISEEFGFGRGFETFHKTWQYVQSETDLGEVARTTEGIETVRALAARLVEGNPLVNVANAVYGQFFRKREDDGARRANREVADWLAARESSRPFFLFANYLEPHLEYRPPEAHAERYLPDGVSYEEAMAISQDAWGYIAGDVEHTEREFAALRGLYRAELAYLDERIGELRDTLRAAGEWEDTVFVLTSDHGENIGDHGLMDHQYCLYETLLDVPLVIHGGAFAGGGVVDDPVQLVDLPPTLLDAADVTAPTARETFQGRSVHPSAEVEPRERAIAEYVAPQPSMDALERRVGSLSPEVRRFDRSLRAIRADGWKLIRGSDGSRELYRLEDDPDERNDRAADDPERATALGDAIDEWLASFEHAAASGAVSMSDDTEARLEDLGYLQ
ncbi:sulfatase [Halococcus agarilyticus]|uniref:sulfatase n=1 Tax=Halococcus agarilyticus TaxID=1232219 RepID=UPI0006778FF3|nr:sulfatase [Halococcus agarilyticus]